MNNLQSEIINIKQILKKLEVKAKNWPTSQLRIDSKLSGQFYVYDEKNQKWQYISKDQIAYVQKLIQRDYETKVLKEAQKQLTAIEKFVSVYDAKYLAKIYEKLHPLRKKMVKPFDITDDEYAAKWLSEKYEKNQREITKPYTTMNNEKVRSKSEALIADRLKALGIPYRYECKLQLRTITFYPDFTILNKRTREIIIYEHFGMMDKEEYANNCIGKLKTYAQNGFILGKNLIASFESGENPLDMKIVEQLIRGSL